MPPSTRFVTSPRRCLHLPTVRAREHAASGESERYLEAMRALYGIDVAVPDDACPATELSAVADPQSRTSETKCPGHSTLTAAGVAE